MVSKSEKNTGWKLATLGDVAIENGLQTGPFGSQLKASEYVADGVPTVMPSDMVGGRIVTDNIARISEEKAVELSRHRLRTGDIIFARRGDIGRCALVTEKEAGWLCGTGSLRARLRREFVFPEFMIHFLNLPQSIAWLNANAVGQTMLNLSTSIVSELPVYLPPLAEQRKIAAILSTWDEAIATVERLIDALQRRKRGLMQRLLTGEVRFPEFVGSEWEFRKAGEIFASHSKRNNGNKELLSVTQEQGVIPRSMLATRVTMPEGSTENYKLVEPGDFVISLRTFQGGIEYSEYLGVVSPAYTVLKPRIPIVNAFYKHLFKSQDFIGRLSIAVVGIRDGKQISFSDFAAMRLAYPALAEQNRIAEVLDACDEQIAARQRMLDALVQQKRGLMQRLLTGEVRVQVDEATQPVAHTAASLDGRMEEVR